MKRKHPIIDFSAKPLYDLQKEVLTNPRRFKVVAWGRQSGKSFTAKRAALVAAVNEGGFVVWISPSIPTAKGHWEDLKAELDELDFPHTRKEQDKTMYFPSGGSIRIRPAINPDNLRGMSPDLVILDEAAYFPNGAYVWGQVIMPMITASRGSVLLLSTPNGHNWFYDLWKLGQKDDPFFKSWHAPSYVSPFQDRQLLDYIKANVHPHVWKVEYMAMFLADGGGVFTNVDRQATTGFLDNPLPNHQYVAGVDWGGNLDYTVFTVLDKWERTQVYGDRSHGLTPDEQIQRIINLLDHWRPVVTHVETNGMGQTLWRMLKIAVGVPESEADTDTGMPTFQNDLRTVFDVEGHHHIRGVFMQNTNKREMIEGLAAGIEFDKLKLLSNTCEFGETQISEMSTFQRSATPSGLPKFGATPGAHDDTVIALALAYSGLPRQKYVHQRWTSGNRQNPFKTRKSLSRPNRRSF